MTKTLSALRKLGFLWLFFLLLPALAHAAAARPIVSVSSPGAGSSYAMPFRIAEEQNFYVDEGLDVRIVSGVRTATSVQMLVGGTVDATQTVGPTTLAAILRGVPLKIVMVFNDKPSYWLYSKKNIRSFAELKGSRISSSSPGSTNDRLLKLVLERNGINWNKDLQIVYIGTSDVVVRALLSGSIDAAVLSHPGNLIAKEAGYNQLATFENEVGALTGGVAVHESFLSKQRDTAVRFLRATLKGLRYFRTNREGSAKIMAKYMSLSHEAALKTHDASVPFYVTDGMISDEFQDKVLDFELKVIGTDKRISRDAVFDFSIMKSLAAK
jgi:NitT/TauT family transport system substrate-binding protein